MGVRVHDNEENLKMRSCPVCPTFKNSELSFGLFSAKGKATAEEIDILESSCLSWDCTVFDKYGLQLKYYCIRGKSAEIPK